MLHFYIIIFSDNNDDNDNSKLFFDIAKIFNCPIVFHNLHTLWYTIIEKCKASIDQVSNKYR